MSICKRQEQFVCFRENLRQQQSAFGNPGAVRVNGGIELGSDVVAAFAFDVGCIAACQLRTVV